MTSAFLLHSSDYNVLHSMEIVLNNFIQYSPCPDAQLLRQKFLLIRALTTIVAKHACPCFRFQAKVHHL